jgi:hypothetical protein
MRRPRLRRPRLRRSSWICRFLRGRRPDRNPLRRRSDRLETTILILLLITICASAPFLAVAASGWENSVSLRELRVQQATCREVKATLLVDAHDTGEYPFLNAAAELRWTAPDGRTVTGNLRVPAGTKAGAVIWIWTNASGQVITPLRQTEIPGRDDLAATAAVATLVTIALITGLTVRLTMHRRRLTAWGIDWMATEPRWNTRR